MRILLTAISLTFCMSLSGIAQTSSREKLIRQGVALHDEGKYTEALRFYAEARKSDTLNEDVNHEIATTYSALNKHTDAIRYADLVLRHGTHNRARAAIVKGNALDHLGRTKEAIQTYKEAIATSTDAVYMLRYNLAFTYYNARIPDDARDQLIAGISENPAHASSHLLLGVVMAESGERAQAVLALTYFLMLEGSGRRAPGALAMLDKQLVKGVTKESDNKININVAMRDKDDPFNAIEIMLSLLAANAHNDAEKAKSTQDAFKGSLTALFEVVGLLEKEESAAFWWKTYGSVFQALDKAGHTETLAYLVRQSANKPEVTAWLEGHPQKIEALSDWYEKATPRTKE